MDAALTLDEVITRMKDLNAKYSAVSREEAEYLLCDALLILKQGDIVDEFLAAKQRSGIV